MLNAQRVKPKLKKMYIPFKNDSTQKKFEYEYSVIDTPPNTIYKAHVLYRREEGKLKARTWFWYGQPDSLYTGYHRSGSLRNEMIYRNGKLNGPAKSFHPGNIPEFTGEYVDGQKNGTWKFYNEDGHLVRTEHWDHGKLKQE